MVRVGVLGPFEWHAADSAHVVRGPKRARIAALLALRANQVVSLDALARELWADAPPGNAVMTLRTHVYHLRQSLPDGRDLLRALPGGYLFALPTDGVDAGLFERLAAQGRSLLTQGRVSEAAQRLRAALSLWRGEPLEGLTAGPLLSGHVARLTELRSRVLQLRIEADLACGLHADLVAELRSVVAADPLNEKMQALLIDALYRSGRRGDALASFQHARRVLGEQLGVEPSGELLRMRERVLAGESRAADRSGWAFADGVVPLEVPPKGAVAQPVRVG
ncbi:MAG TPA: AfsR/SARP family transcriptional regulator [Micromonosporaceae bacterium]